MTDTDTEYRVRWEIDVSANDMIEAAKQAHRIMLDPDSTATVFKVAEWKNDQEGYTGGLKLPYTEIDLRDAKYVSQDYDDTGTVTIGNTVYRIEYAYNYIRMDLRERYAALLAEFAHNAATRLIPRQVLTGSLSVLCDKYEFFGQWRVIPSNESDNKDDENAHAPATGD